MEKHQIFGINILKRRVEGLILVKKGSLSLYEKKSGEPHSGEYVIAAGTFYAV